MTISPHLFLILFAILVAISAAIAVFIILNRKEAAPDRISAKDIKSHFEDVPLQNVIQKLRNHLAKNFRCFKCQERRYETNPFDADLFEVYCQGCGLKRFYHIDLLAGSNRPEKKINSPWFKEWIKDFRKNSCPDCKNTDYREFKMLMDVKNKIGGFWDRKKIELYLSSCKQCGFVQFYDRTRS